MSATFDPAPNGPNSTDAKGQGFTALIRQHAAQTWRDIRDLRQDFWLAMLATVLAAAVGLLLPGRARTLIEGAFPEVAVLTFSELDPELQVRPVGRLVAVAQLVGQAARGDGDEVVQVVADVLLDGGDSLVGLDFRLVGHAAVKQTSDITGHLCDYETAIRRIEGA